MENFNVLHNVSNTINLILKFLDISLDNYNETTAQIADYLSVINIRSSISLDFRELSTIVDNNYISVFMDERKIYIKQKMPETPIKVTPD